MKTKERLQTTLDRLPYGPEGMPEDQKVSKKLPEGVRSRELYEDIVRIAGPSFVELLLTQLTSMVDLMMVGSMGGTENLEMGTQALAAVGLTTQPKFLLMAAFVSMNTGVTALVARNRGRGDQEKANLVVRQGLLFTFWATVLMSILGVVFARANGDIYGFHRGDGNHMGHPVSSDPDGRFPHHGADQYHNGVAAGSGGFKNVYDLQHDRQRRQRLL